MKRIINYTLIILGMMTSSCENLESINEDPNNAEHTHPKLLLKTILHYLQGQGTGQFAPDVCQLRRVQQRSVNTGTGGA